MLKRRRFITSAATAGAITVAGCSSDEGDPTGSTEGEESPDENTNEEDESAEQEDSDEEEESAQESTSEAQFELVEWNLPSEIEINESTNLAVTVENVGDSAGELTAPIYERTPDSEWTRLGEVEFGTIQPGKEAEVEGDEFVYRYINRYEYRLSDFRQTTTVQTVSAQIDWGTEYTTPSGYIIRVDEPDLQSSYEYETYSGEVSPEEPESGGQWAFANAYVRNETGQTNYSPLASDIDLLYENSQADGDTILINEPINKGDPFDGGELQPGVERSGWIAYQVPRDVSVNDLTIAWSKTTFEGEVAVNWE